MSDTLDAQYLFLAELKEIDARAHHLERDAERIPEEIRQKDEALYSKRLVLDQAKTQVNDCEKALRAAERELKEKEDSLFKAEGKMMEVKTNEEYQAALRENQTQKQAKGSLEEKALQLISQTEEQKRLLGEIEQEFKGCETSVLLERKKLSDEHQDLIKQLEQLLRQRQSIASKMDPEIGRLYLKIVSQARGVAVTTAEYGRCMGCNVQLRPQIYNEILGRKSVHRCPSCGRILIVPARVLAAETGGELAAK